MNAVKYGLLAALLAVLVDRPCLAAAEYSFAPNMSAAQLERRLLIESARQERMLGGSLAEQLGGAQRASEYTHKLMLIELLRQVGAAKLDEVAALESGREFLEILANDYEWLEMLLASGPLGKDPALVLRRLYELWIFDRDCAKFRSEKTLATAIALEYGRRNWPAEPAVERYVFYRDSKRAGQLHPIYDELDVWEKRYLVGQHYASFYGPIGSMEWLRDNVKLPVDKYTGACWQVPYRSYNMFGDSVQGPMYYYPFEGAFPTFAEMARFVGAVCGRLSGYGAAAAQANGIPATTMGEPGHCAYAVRTRKDHWAPAYSLSWKRGVHFNFYGGRWSQLVLDNRNFGDSYRFKRAQQHLWQARRWDGEDAARAETAFLLALKAQPGNYPIWQEYAQWCRANSNTIAKWTNFQQAMLASLAKDYPEIAWMILEGQVYPAVMEQLEAKQKMAFMGKFHEAISDWGPARWNFEAAVDRQLKYIGAQESSEFGFMRGMIVSHLESQGYLSALLSWGQSRYASDTERRDIFFGLILGAVSRGNGEAGKDALLDMCSAAIREAGRNKDHDAFLAVGRIIESLLPPLSPEQQARGRNLLSKNGMVRFSSVSGSYDKNSYQHWGLINERGGFFHTDTEQDPWVELTLAHFGQIERLHIVNRASHQGRAVPLEIQVSVDGESWETVEELSQARREWEVDLTGHDVRARYIRLRKRGRDCLHLEQIRVYGKRLS
jgi:hypothetical protein